MCYQSHRHTDLAGFVPVSLCFGGVAAVQMVGICELDHKQTGDSGYGNLVLRPFGSERLRC